MDKVWAIMEDGEAMRGPSFVCISETLAQEITARLCKDENHSMDSGYFNIKSCKVYSNIQQAFGEE